MSYWAFGEEGMHDGATASAKSKMIGPFRSCEGTTPTAGSPRAGGPHTPSQPRSNNPRSPPSSSTCSPFPHPRGGRPPNGPQPQPQPPPSRGSSSSSGSDCGSSRTSRAASTLLSCPSALTRLDSAPSSELQRTPSVTSPSPYAPPGPGRSPGATQPLTPPPTTPATAYQARGQAPFTPSPTTPATAYQAVGRAPFTPAPVGYAQRPPPEEEEEMPFSTAAARFGGRLTAASQQPRFGGGRVPGGAFPYESPAGEGGGPLAARCGSQAQVAPLSGVQGEGGALVARSGGQVQGAPLAGAQGEGMWGTSSPRRAEATFQSSHARPHGKERQSDSTARGGGGGEGRGGEGREAGAEGTCPSPLCSHPISGLQARIDSCSALSFSSEAGPDSASPGSPPDPSDGGSNPNDSTYITPQEESRPTDQLLALLTPKLPDRRFQAADITHSTELAEAAWREMRVGDDAASHGSDGVQDALPDIEQLQCALDAIDSEVAEESRVNRQVAELVAQRLQDGRRSLERLVRVLQGMLVAEASYSSTMRHLANLLAGDDGQTVPEPDGTGYGAVSVFAPASERECLPRSSSGSNGGWGAAGEGGFEQEGEEGEGRDGAWGGGETHGATGFGVGWGPGGGRGGRPRSRRPSSGSSAGSVTQGMPSGLTSPRGGGGGCGSPPPYRPDPSDPIEGLLCSLSLLPAAVSRSHRSLHASLAALAADCQQLLVTFAKACATALPEAAAAQAAVDAQRAALAHEFARHAEACGSLQAILEDQAPTVALALAGFAPGPVTDAGAAAAAAAARWGRPVAALAAAHMDPWLTEGDIARQHRALQLAQEAERACLQRAFVRAGELEARRLEVSKLAVEIVADSYRAALTPVVDDLGDLGKRASTVDIAARLRSLTLAAESGASIAAQLADQQSAMLRDMCAGLFRSPEILLQGPLQLLDDPLSYWKGGHAVLTRAGFLHWLRSAERLDAPQASYSLAWCRYEPGASQCFHLVETRRRGWLLGGSETGQPLRLIFQAPCEAQCREWVAAVRHAIAGCCASVSGSGSEASGSNAGSSAGNSRRSSADAGDGVGWCR